jgi:hypothetical protein
LLSPFASGADYFISVGETAMAVWQGRTRWQTPVLVILLFLAGSPAQAAEKNACEERMRKDIFFLASDECEGRGVDTKGINLAADYIANEFKKAGLKPGGPDGSWFQPFPIRGSARLGTPNALALNGPLGQEIELKLDEHFAPLGLSSSGKAVAPLVFVGYGITTKDAAYDDYAGMDVAGKVVIMLRKTPRPGNTEAPFDGDNNTTDAALVTKMENAGKHEAAAVVFVNDTDSAKNQDTLMPFSYSARGASPASLPAVHVRRALADELLQSSLGVRLRDLEADIDRDLKPRSAPLTGWSARLEVNVNRSDIAAKNVVGVLEETGPKAKEIIILGAHYDHLGYGGFGSLARQRTPAIHHGADDNGSGTTALMELARRFAQVPQRDRKLVFMAFSGEERGLLGSAYYCQHPLFPLADTVTMVNMDMVGRLRPDKDSNKDKLIVYGTGTAKTFDHLIETLNETYDFKLQKIPGGMGPSDHASFYAKGIPVFFFFTGDHSDYHRPSDTADKINVPGMRRVTDLMENLVTHLLKSAQRPEFVKVATFTAPRPGPGGPRLGIRPSYGDDQEGVLLEDVIGGGPADKAGLKGGDRIVDIGEKPVKNLEAYMSLLAGHKKGDALKLVIVRDGKKMNVEVKPE